MHCAGPLAQPWHPLDTGLRKKSTEEATTATRFMVFPTEKVTGEMPWSKTM